jgi:RNA polymerase sigma-70 factor (ECF subfamily)
MMPARPTSPRLEFEEVLAQARAGCPRAMGRLLEARQQQLLEEARRKIPAGFCHWMTGSDLVQETLMAAQQCFKQFRGNSPGEFKGWLEEILRTTILDYSRAFQETRKRQLSREVPLDTSSPEVQAGLAARGGPSPLEIVTEWDVRVILQQCLDLLPPEYAQVVRLRSGFGPNYEELGFFGTFDEIGARMGISGEAARKIHCRALQVLGKLAMARKLAECEKQ